MKVFTVSILFSLFLSLPTIAASLPTEIGNNFWDISWGGNTNDPFVNTHRNVLGTNPWKQPFIDEIKPYTVLRFMDWCKVNGAEQYHTGRWADRTQKNDAVQYPVAYDWMIDLCNRAGTDMWVCIPHVADQDYWQQLAVLIHDQLDPSLRVYVEHSNETWNDMFSQAQYGKQKALEVGITESNEWYRGQKYQAWVNFRIFQVFETVFAADRHRLVTVMGSTDGHAFAETHMECQDDPFYNPGNVKMDALAVAPYFGANVNGGSATAINDLYAAIDDRSARNRLIKSKLDAEDIQFIIYEAGQHVLQGTDVICRDSRIYNVYRAYLDSMALMFPLLVHYTHSGTFGSGGAWGSKEYIGQPLEQAHKYRALYDYAVDNGQWTAGAQRSVRIRTASLFTPQPLATGSRAGRPAAALTVLPANPGGARFDALGRLGLPEAALRPVKNGLVIVRTDGSAVPVLPLR